MTLTSPATAVFDDLAAAPDRELIRTVRGSNRPRTRFGGVYPFTDRDAAVFPGVTVNSHSVDLRIDEVDVLDATSVISTSTAP